MRKLRGSATQASKTPDADKLEIATARGGGARGGGGGGGGEKTQEQLYEAMDTRYQVGGVAGRVQEEPYERMGVPHQAAEEEDIYENPV